ncbi:MAG: hypothetical protein M3Q07_05235 [Pseudobdellovibrionaceae bacterium]|nr:hypothetical protein [Pseudobdellovibrionaceae bacterium]
MDGIYYLEVGNLSNGEALISYFKNVQPEDLACFIRHNIHDPEIETTCITITRRKNIMCCQLGKPDPSWPIGLTETDSEGKHEWRSIINSGSTLAFLGKTFLQGTGEANRFFILDYASKLDNCIETFNKHETVWLEP